MRLLHTADWHVGRTLRGRSRAEEHEAVLDEVVGVAQDERVDLVVVAGDLFDTSAPPPEAERLVYRTLLRLAEQERQVVVIAGNHDHPRRLAAVEPLLDLARVRVRPVVAAPAEGGVLELEVAGTPTRLALLPWLSHRHAVSADDLLARDADQHNQTYLDRMRRITAALCDSFGGQTVNIAVGHLTAVGGLLGGGERTAHTVFDYAVPATVFPPTASYVALGHLHRNQRLDAAAPTWYSGAPLQLDFGEGENTPAVQLVELHPGRPARPETVPLGAGRRLRTVTGSLAELDALIDPGATDHLRLVVRERLRAGLADEVRDRFPHAVEVRIELEDPAHAARGAGGGREGEQAGRTPAELFADYLADQDIDDARVARLFDRLLGEDDDAA